MPRKPKLPRLVVDNKPADADEYVEFNMAVDGMLALHKRYPEIKKMYKRALADKDHAMTSGLLNLTMGYYDVVDALTKEREQRKNLKLVKKKPQP